MSRLIATVFWIGYLRPASGTWGSAAALPIAWVLHGLGGLPLLVTATCLLFPLGWWATANMIRGQEDHDPSEVVVDEVVGQWIALWPLSFGLWHAGADSWVFPYPGWLTAFVLFRLFDVLKPGPVGWADRRGDALGVMLDDVIAGLIAAVGVLGAAMVFHGWLI